MPRRSVISSPNPAFADFGDETEVSAAPGPLARGQSVRRSRRRTTWLMLALAAGLSLAGLGGIIFDRALRVALRPATAADEASAACTYLRSQDYTALAGEMNPSPDQAGPSSFDRATFVAQLRALDRSEGTVQGCTLRQLGPTGNARSVVFTLTVRRARVPVPLSSLVVVQATPQNTWTISRSSTFYYSAAPPGE